MADEHATLLTADTIIWLKVQPLAQNGFPYLCNIITSSYYYREAMKISDLQAALITISCYSHGKMKAENIGRLLLEPKMMIMIN